MQLRCPQTQPWPALPFFKSLPASHAQPARREGNRHTQARAPAHPPPASLPTAHPQPTTGPLPAAFQPTWQKAAL